MNSLLKWGIENADASRQSDAAPPSREAPNLSVEALRSLMGGPSDPDLMKEAMGVIVSTDPEVTLESKVTAFDNFEQLVENIDNANNVASMGLWPPLISQLDSPEPELRRMAAWCAGTAVQNNVKAQERMLEANAIPKLCKLAVEDPNEGVRRKAAYAISSEIRNYQPGMDEAVKNLPKNIVGPDEVSCTDMGVIDAIMANLRDR